MLAVGAIPTSTFPVPAPSSAEGAIPQSPFEVAVPRRPDMRARKAIAVVQSSYIPWKGYFDLIHSVDEFILFDEVQYTRRDWRNRNRIKTKEGLLWLTVPVLSKGRREVPIREVMVSDPGWRARHWKTILMSYGRSRHFQEYSEGLRELYLGHEDRRLSEVNYRFTEAISRMLGIRTRLSWPPETRPPLSKSERIVEICRHAGATTYLSGPTARDYLDLELFRQENIELLFFDYSRYPEYTQLHPPFDHRVSVLDLLLNEGPRATRFMLSFGPWNSPS
jgi:hypothetical protein